MNYSTETFDAVVALARTLRPNWDTPGLRKAIRDALGRDDQPTIAELTYAVLRCAENFTIASPAVIALDGPHWRLAAKSPYGPVAVDCQKCRRTHMPAFDCQAAQVKPATKAERIGEAAQWFRDDLATKRLGHCQHHVPRDLCADCTGDQPAYTTQGAAE